MFRKLKLVTILILIAHAGLFAQGKIVDEIIAVVGDRVILESDIEKQAIQYRQQGYFGEGNIKCEILEEQLYQKMLLNQAELDSVEVSEAEIDGEMNRRIQMFISQLGSEEKLEEFYGKSILEIKQEFRPIVADQIRSQRMQMELTRDLDVTPTDVRKFYESIPKDSLPLISTKLELQQIVSDPRISEVDVLAVKERLQDFRKRIQGGERFATLAALYSQDEGTAAKGGKLGYVGRNDLVPEFAAVAFKLEKGQVSRVVKTEYGYHIIELIDRRGEKINVRHILLKPKVKVEEKVKSQQFLDSIRNEILHDTLEWDEAAKIYSDDEETRTNGGIIINYQSGSSQFEQSQVKPSIAFAIKDMKEGEISAPFEDKTATGQTVFKIVRIKSKTESHKANLIDDYQEIQEMALMKKKEKFVEDWVDNKRESTYIRIDEQYRDCKFKYKWLK
ncbi:MAG: peptidylprolyl isomerase [Salinivirgaceae bacterium]|nr:MAG: peptidylprolyl isomerase [Salinivirgaceae bacterium]